ncbi:6893_t:CDS:2 [Entrophospora sp. SA101]|nr:6893_t:CDS:2 [Entrophospora sp. SA101]
MTGVGLGLTSSVKWVGLFTIATIGFSTIKGLWDLLGNLRVSPTQWTKHFMARALGLIIVPIALYMFFFSIHFLILSNSGDGDGFMSTEFRQTLNGNYKTKDTPIDVAYDSMITIKHVNTAGGYLHSHRHNYPEGSKRM